MIEVTNPTTKLPALFGTIHFRSDDRPDGYTDEEIVELNERLNGETPPSNAGGENPA